MNFPNGPPIFHPAITRLLISVLMGILFLMAVTRCGLDMVEYHLWLLKSHTKYSSSLLNVQVQRNF